MTECEQSLDSETQQSSSIEEKTSAAEFDESKDKDDTLASATPVEHFTGFRLNIITLALQLGMFLVALDMTIVATAIPSITDEFKSLDQVGWYGSAFFLTVAAFQSPWGKAYKYLGLKGTFFAAVIIFELGSLVCAVSNNSTTLIIGRAICGMGGAGISGGVFTITAFITPPNLLATYLGLSGAIFSIASVAGPLMGGAFTEKITWRWCFYINLPVGGVTLVLLAIFFHTPSHAVRAAATWYEKFLQTDPLGLVAIIAALVLYMLALEWGGVQLDWNNSRVVGTLIGWLLLTVVFLVDQWLQKERALLVVRIFKRRTVTVCCTFIFLLNAANFLLIYNLPIYFQAIDNASPVQSGIRNLPLICASAVFTLLCSHLTGRISYVQPFMIAGSAILAIGAGLLYTLDIDSSMSKYIGYQLLLGIGIGTAIQMPVITVQAVSDMSDVAVATAVVLFFQLVSGALSVSAAQCVFENVMLNSLPTYAPDVNPAMVIATGATSLRSTFSPRQIDGILLAYMEGLRAAWAMGIAFSCTAVVVAFFLEWKPIRAVAVGGGP